MGDPEALNFENTSLLDADSVPNENQSHECFSCGEDMTGLYCYACGNKNDNYRRSIWSLGIELFSSLTALEGRIWRSLKSLILRPGQMAREYADGARQRWTSPVRMYLATSLILFGYIAISGTQLIAFGPKQTSEETLEMEDDDFQFTPAIYFLKRQSELKTLISDDAISAFQEGFSEILTGDGEKTIEDLETEIERNTEAIANMQKQMEAMKYGRSGVQAGIDAIEKRNETLRNLIDKKRNAPPTAPETTQAPPTQGHESQVQDKTEDTPESPGTPNTDGDNGGWLNITGPDGQKYTLDRDSTRSVVSTAFKQPERINGPIGKYLPRIMFFMMPFSMLMGAIFIRGKQTAMLYDHLVHAAYIHAFSFLLLFIFILFVQFTSIPHLLGIYTLILLIYLPISAKRMFKRGWFKSILTSYGVGMVYTIIMVLILVSLIGMGLFDIATQYADSEL